MSANNLEKTDIGEVQQNHDNNLPIKRSRTEQALAALLASFGEDIEKCQENFSKQGISFKDLANLTKDDLIRLGVNDPEMIDEMITAFQELPNQNTSYEKVINSAEAVNFNMNILNQAKSHVSSMETAIAATNLKLRVKPSGDVVLDDKCFASNFVMEALEELKKITEEIEERLEMLEMVTDARPTKRKVRLVETIFLTGVAALTIGIWYLKFR